MTIQKFILSLFCILTLVGTATAQDFNDDILPPVVNDVMPEAEILPDVSLQKKTHPEKIIFSQIKLSGDAPDIDAMAKASPRVSKAQPIDKAAMIFTEYNRINNAFSLHDEKAEIVVHTILEADEYSSLQDMLVFDELDETTFFQFGLYNYHVGIVPENIQRFSRLALSKPSAERMFSVIGDDEILAEFILKPVYADKKEPFVMQDKEFWLMFARIAELRLWSDKIIPDLVWYYRAPWYKPSDNGELGNLYNQQ